MPFFGEFGRDRAGSAFVDEAVAFAIEARQRKERHTADIDSKPEPEVKFLGNSRGLLQMIFHFYQQLIECAVFAGRHAVLDDLWETVENLFDGGRKDIDAADDHHVVCAAEHAPFQQHEAARTGGRPAWPHEVACAVAEDGSAAAS